MEIKPDSNSWEGVFLGNPEDSVWEDWGTLGNIRGITTRGVIVGHQPKLHALFKGKWDPQNHHRFAFFDTPKIGNLMSPVKTLLFGKKKHTWNKKQQVHYFDGTQNSPHCLYDLCNYRLKTVSFLSRLFNEKSN